MEYTKEDLDIFKRVINDYKELKNEIDKRIAKGYTMENLLDYVRHLASCDITNYDLISDYKYIDINYCDMTVSILEENNKCFLGDSLEVWNNVHNYYIGLFNSIRELESILKESEDK